LRKVRYGACLSVVLSDERICLSFMFPFGFGNPPLFLPRQDVAAITPEQTQLESRAVITLKDQRAFRSTHAK
jgi:hypothetical protein